MATIKLYRKSKRQPCYRLSYRDPVSGKWRQKLLHVSKDEAEELRKKVEAEFYWYQANPHLADKEDDYQFLLLNEAKERFLKSKQSTVKAKTFRRYKQVITAFTEFIGLDVPVSTLSRFVIDDYREKLLELRKPAGVNSDLRHLRTFLNFCNENGWTGQRIRVVMAKVPRNPVRWLSKDEFTRLLDQVNILDEPEVVSDIIKVTLLTGARISEILQTPWKDIDLKNGLIKLADDKGNHGDPLILNRESKSILKKYRDVTPAPFPYSYDWIEWRYQKIAKAAGIRTTIHDLRKTAGAWLIEQNVDIYGVSKFLRHTSVTVTERFYVDILPKNRRKIAEQTANFF